MTEPVADVDVLHVLFGGLGGQLSVATELAAQFRCRGLRSGALLYAPPGAFVDDEVVEAAFDAVVRVEKRARLDLAGSRRIGQSFDLLRPRAVLWHSAYAPVVMRRARSRGRPRVVLLVEHQPLAQRRPGDAFRTSTALAVADGVVVLSEDYRRRYRFRFMARSLGRPIVTISNGVDLDLFRPRSSEGAEARQQPRAGMMGRMVPTKDFASLVRAAAELRRTGFPELGLVLAGDGSERRALEELVRELGLEHAVTFTGTLGERELVAFLHGLEVYVHSTFGETASTALLQACAAGLPIVASDVPGVNDILRNGSDAVLVPPGSPRDLAAAMARVLEDAALRASLSASARARAVSGFGAEKMATGYLAALASHDPSGPWRPGGP